MFRTILKTWLKTARKHHLLPFIDGLWNVGRPSAVIFPIELIEQGFSLLLSGLNNTLAIQSNPDWVWPYWLERQQDPDAREFIPTGMNVLTSNLSMRNWTSLGLPGTIRESMIDPVGMLTLYAYGWSVTPYLVLDGKRHLPPRMGDKTRQFPEEGDLPCVVTEYQIHEELDWNCKAMSLRVAGEELIAYTHHLTNRSSQPIAVTLGLAIRPYNPLTIGHINKLKFKNRLWRVNRKPGLLLLQEPDRVRVSDRHRGDPMFAATPEATETHGVSKSGILSGACEFDMTLQPGEKRDIQSYGTQRKVSEGPNLKFRNLDPVRLEQAMEETQGFWRDNRHRGLTLSLPDKQLETAFSAVKNHIYVFDDGAHFTPGLFFYHTHWIRDSAFIALAFENLGFRDEVRKKIDGYLATQTKDGFFRSQNGEWDSTGQAMFTLINHIRRGGDAKLLERCYPYLVKGFRWIRQMTRGERKSVTPHYGLLPAGISAEHFGPNDHYYWDNFWSIAGLRQLLWAARKIGQDKDHEAILEFYDEYRHDLGSSMDAAAARVGQDRLPCSPYRQLDTAAIGNLVSVNPLDIYAPDTPWLKPTVDWLLENNLRGGLFFQKIIHTGLNAYLSVQLARALMSLDDPRFEQIMAGLLQFASPTYTWPEAIHPVTKGGCMGDGDHGWAAAEFLSLTRDMFVREQQRELLIGSGIPAHWYGPDMNLSVKNASSYYGDIDYSLRQQAGQLVLDWTIKRHAMQDHRPVFLLLPQNAGYACPGQAETWLNRQKIPLQGDGGTLVFPSVAQQAAAPEAASLK